MTTINEIWEDGHFHSRSVQVYPVSLLCPHTTHAQHITLWCFREYCFYELSLKYENKYTTFFKLVNFLLLFFLVENRCVLSCSCSREHLLPSGKIRRHHMRRPVSTCRVVWSCRHVHTLSRAAWSFAISLPGDLHGMSITSLCICTCITAGIRGGSTLVAEGSTTVLFFVTDSVVNP